MALCPWIGKACDCAEFPWLVNDAIPAKCEHDMPIEMAAVRKVSATTKERYKLYLIPCRRCKMRFEKKDRSVLICQKCETGKPA